MSNFLNDTILTNYGLNKLNLKLTNNNYNFNFNKIVITDTKITLDEGFNSSFNTTYTLDVESVKYSNEKVVISCQLSPNIDGFNIRGIMLYESNNLFSVSAVNTVKPTGLDYSLTIIINIKLKDININIFPTISVTDYSYVSESEKSDLEFIYSDSVINLERAISKNTTQVGYDKAQVFYDKLNTQFNLSYDYQDIYQFSLLKNYFDKNNNTVQGCYYMSPYIFKQFYKSNELIERNSVINYNAGLIYSDSTLSNFDKIYFNQSGGSLSFKAQLNNLSNEFIIGKAVEGNYYFSVTFSYKDSILYFRIYGRDNSEYLEQSYPISLTNIRQFTSRINTYTMVYYPATESTSAIFVVYFNDDILNTTFKNVNFSELSPHYYFPLVNYGIQNNTVVYSPTNIFYNFMSFNKILTKNDIFTLNCINLTSNLISN
jgi:hypothetical protein